MIDGAIIVTRGTARLGADQWVLAIDCSGGQSLVSFEITSDGSSDFEAGTACGQTSTFYVTFAFPDPGTHTVAISVTSDLEPSLTIYARIIPPDRVNT
jgi:hypothetical protein